MTSITGASFGEVDKDPIPKVFDQDNVGAKPKTVQYRQRGKGTLFSKAPLERVDPEDDEK